MDIVARVLQVEADKVFQTKLKTYSMYGIHPTSKEEFDEIKDEVMYDVLTKLTTLN